MYYKDILAKGLQIIAQLKAFHWQTSNNAQHQLLGTLYQDFDEQNDELMQVIMGNLGKRIGVGQGVIHLQNVTNLNPEQYLQSCAQFYQSVLQFFDNQTGNSGINDILYDIINMFRKGLYLIRQESKMKKGQIVEWMRKSDEQLITELLNREKSTLKESYKRKFQWLGSRRDFKRIVDEIRHLDDQYIQKIDYKKMEIFTTEGFNPSTALNHRKDALNIREFYH